VVATIIDTIPDDLLLGAAGERSEFASASEARDRYRRYLTRRLQAPRAFTAEAIAAQGQVRREPPRHISARR
jgi:hypothetical protein